MIITVLPIIEPNTTSGAPLVKVMNERLKRMASELQNTHLKPLENYEPVSEDLVVYISYDNKYNIRWKIVNDIPDGIESLVAKHCDKLGYIKWKTTTLNTFNRNI